MNDAPVDQLLLQNAMRDELTVRITDKIYYQAFEYFRICNIVIYISAVCKLVATPYYAFTTELTHVSLFLLALFAVSIMQIVTCRFTAQILKNLNIYYEIADNLGHSQDVLKTQLSPMVLNADYRFSQTYDYTEPNAEQDERKMKTLALQIKYHINHASQRFTYINRLNFALYQFVHFWGVCLLIFYNFPQKQLETYVIIIVVIGTYQYLEIYILVLFFIVILPFFAIKQIYHYVVMRYKAYKLQKILQSRPYTDSIKGDHECKICLMPYEATDSIIVLKCSEIHNFHSGCFGEWAKTSSTCPLCRKDITSL